CSSSVAMSPVFFVSSRRRHTRWPRDWSSDVCSSDLQFKLVADELALCWVHDGRHYQSLTPCVPQHREWLEAFRQRYWEFYKQLRSEERRVGKVSRFWGRWVMCTRKEFATYTYWQALS